MNDEGGSGTSAAMAAPFVPPCGPHAAARAASEAAPGPAPPAAPWPVIWLISMLSNGIGMLPLVCGSEKFDGLPITQLVEAGLTQDAFVDEHIRAAVSRLDESKTFRG